MQREERQVMKREALSRRRRPRSPNGKRRATTTRQERNMLVIDFGEDIEGVKQAVLAKAQRDGRTLSSVVREILKRTLVDFQIR